MCCLACRETDTRTLLYGREQAKEICRVLKKIIVDPRAFLCVDLRGVTSSGQHTFARVSIGNEQDIEIRLLNSGLAFLPGWSQLAHNSATYAFPSTVPSKSTERLYESRIKGWAASHDIVPNRYTLR